MISWKAVLILLSCMQIIFPYKKGCRNFIQRRLFKVITCSHINTEHSWWKPKPHKHKSTLNLFSFMTKFKNSPQVRNGHFLYIYTSKLAVFCVLSTTFSLSLSLTTLNIKINLQKAEIIFKFLFWPPRRQCHYLQMILLCWVN